MSNYPANWWTKVTRGINAQRSRGKKETAPSRGRVGWFNAGKQSPVRDGLYEFRARGYRVTADKWHFHPRTDGYHPVYFDAEFGYWHMDIGGTGAIIIPAISTEFLSAFEWRGLTLEEHVRREEVA